MPRRRSPRTAVVTTAVMLVLMSLAGGVAQAAEVVIPEGVLFSYDATPIYYTLFEPEGEYSGDEDGDIPLALLAHGWGESRVTDPSHPQVRALLDGGYAVLTWDSRGFGRSGGEVNFHYPDLEVRDLRTLIDEIVVRPEIATDDVDFSEVIEVPKVCNPEPYQSPLVDLSPVGSAIPTPLRSNIPGPVQSLLYPPPEPTEEPTCEGTEEITVHHKGMDPKVGVIGAGYGGAAALMISAADPRIDAIVAEQTYSDLSQAFRPNGVFKLAWEHLFFAEGFAHAAAEGLQNQPRASTTPDPNDGPVPQVFVENAPQAGSYAPGYLQARAEQETLNDWSSTSQDFIDARSPSRYIDGGTLPDDTELPGVLAASLLIQSVNDQLFNLSHAVNAYRTIDARTDAKFDRTDYDHDGDPGTPNVPDNRFNDGEVPAKLVAICGGEHTIQALGVPATPVYTPSCTPSADQTAHLAQLRMAWLDRWVKLDPSVNTGPPVEYELQGGQPGLQFRGRDHLPLSSVALRGETRLKGTVAPTNGLVLGPQIHGCHPRAARPDCPVKGEADWIPVGTLTGPPVPRDPSRLPSLEPPRQGTVILGTGRVKVGVSAIAPEVTVFLKLLEYDPIAKKALIIDEQVTPVKIPWPSLDSRKNVSIDFGGLAWEVRPPQTSGGRPAPYEYYIEITTTSNDHAASRYPTQSTIFIEGFIPAIVTPFVKTPSTNSFPKPATESLKAPVKSSNVTMTGLAEPGALLSFVDNGVSLGETTTCTETTSIPPCQGGPGTWTFTKILAEGQHLMKVSTISDSNGTVIDSGERCFNVDDAATAPPAPTVTVSGTGTPPRTIKVEVTALPQHTVVVKENGVQIGNQQTQPSCSATVAKLAFSKTYTAADDGAHTVSVIVTDTSGNVTTTPVNFTVPFS